VKPPTFSAAFREQLADLFRWRRDVRHFRPDPIDRSTLETLVAEATLSPSVGFSQPWRFVSVDDASRREAIVASFERANADALRGYSGDNAAKYTTLKLAGLRDAPVHLAVFCDESTTRGKGLGRATMPETLAYSAANAVYTFWLAARAHGIGAGWVSILEPDVVTTALEVPSEWKLIAYLCVGYPLEEHDSPELERENWETRDTEASRLHRR